MSLTAILLVVLSAFMHATWNLMGKKVSPTVAFFSLAFFTGTLPLTPIALPLIASHSTALLDILPLLLLTGIFQALYGLGLAKSYAAGDMSITYPLARAIPIMLVAVLSAVVGLQSLSGWGAYLGVVLVIMGAVFLPMKHLRDFSFRNYLNFSTLFALLAAAATTGYSIVDKLAVDQLSESLEYSALTIAIIYIWLQNISAGLIMFAGQMLRPIERAELFSVFKHQRLTVFITGIMVTLTYVLILWAMQFTDNVSYVVALRQISIPIGALLGVVIFKEVLGLSKACALVMLSFGVVLILL